MVTILAAVGNLFSFQFHPLAKEKTPPLFRKWGLAKRQPIRLPGKLVIRFRVYIPFPSFSLRPLRQNIKPLPFEVRIKGEGNFDSEIPHHPETYSIYETEAPFPNRKRCCHARSMKLWHEKLRLQDRHHIFLKPPGRLQAKATL